MIHNMCIGHGGDEEEYLTMDENEDNTEIKTSQMDQSRRQRNSLLYYVVKRLHEGKSKVCPLFRSRSSSSKIRALFLSMCGEMVHGNSEEISTWNTRFSIVYGP